MNTLCKPLGKWLLFSLGALGCTEPGPVYPPPDLAGDLSGGSADLLETSLWTLDPNKPLSLSLPGLMQRDHPRPPSALYGTTVGPLPTNAWFQNFVLGGGQNRVATLPYQVKSLTNELAFAVPPTMTQAKAITTQDQVQLRFGAVEGLTAGRKLKSYDALSATILWPLGGTSMEAPITLGMPYVTMRYAKATPRLLTGAGVALVSVNGSMAPGMVRGSRFELRLNDGSTWILYGSPALDLNWNSGGLTALATYSGSLRAAFVPDPAAVSALDAHAGAIPLSGAVSATIQENQATVRLSYKTEGQGPYLVMAMPHHKALLSGGTMVESLKIATSSGTVTGVVGDLVLRYPLPNVGFSAPRPIDPSMKAEIVSALAADTAKTPAASIDTDPYFGGKQLAKWARLALIAEELEDRAKVLSLLTPVKNFLQRWLDGQNPNPLLYDRTYGGIVTQKGLYDPNGDFGQGYYNDHHFHYGYFLYSAAVLCKMDGDFCTKYREKILWLVRDIANPSPMDRAFVPFRHFDFYAGHSWAAGLFEFGDGRNQESTSEAVNAWYGMQLLGIAQKNRDLEHLGRLLLGMEITSAQVYWQVQSKSEVYKAPLRDQGVIGIRWSSKADVATFFGANLEFVFGIQMLPITPITEALLHPTWLRDVDGQILAAARGAQDGWKGILHLGRAGIDKEGARRELSALSSFDDGNSKTNSLYHIATR